MDMHHNFLVRQCLFFRFVDIETVSARYEYGIFLIVSELRAKPYSFSFCLKSNQWMINDGVSGITTLNHIVHTK